MQFCPRGLHPRREEIVRGVVRQSGHQFCQFKTILGFLWRQAPKDEEQPQKAFRSA
jgi:hypothetical protein